MRAFAFKLHARATPRPMPFSKTCTVVRPDADLMFEWFTGWDYVIIKLASSRTGIPLARGTDAQFDLVVPKSHAPISHQVPRRLTARIGTPPPGCRCARWI